jgi:hypothetical protein
VTTGANFLLGPQFLEFVAARGAEALQQIDRAVDGHFAQFDETWPHPRFGRP